MIFGVVFIVYSVATRQESAILSMIAYCSTVAICAPHHSKRLVIIVGVTVVALLLNFGVDRLCYTADWDYFSAFNRAKFPLIDLNGLKTAERALTQPNELGLSINDLKLLRKWWLIDDRMASVEIFESLWRSISAKHFKRPLSQPAIQVLESVLTIRAVPSLIIWAATVVFVKETRIRVGLVVLLLVVLLLLFMLQWSGRGVPPRVVHAVLAPIAIGISCWVVLEKRELLRPLLVGASIAAASSAYYCFSIAASDLAAHTDWKDYTEKSIADELPFGETVHVVIGDSLSFEYVFPLVSASGPSPKLVFFPLGWATWSPPVQAAVPGGSKGMVELFNSGHGVPMFYTEATEKLLRTYCEERFGGDLQIVRLRQFRNYRHARLSCV